MPPTGDLPRTPDAATNAAVCAPAAAMYVAGLWETAIGALIVLIRLTGLTSCSAGPGGPQELRLCTTAVDPLKNAYTQGENG